MAKDGSNKKQVTFFNEPDSVEHITYADGGIVASSDDAWSPFGGDTAVCYVQIFGTQTSRQIFYLIGANQPVPTDTNTAIYNMTGATHGFSFYPNPANGKITVNLQQFSPAPVTLKIYGLNGDLVYDRQLSGSAVLQSVQINGLAKGVYVIQAIAESGVYNGKLVIE